MLLVGGTSRLSSTATPLARGVAYDPAMNRWRWLAPMAYPRSGFVASGPMTQLVVWGGIGAGRAIPPHGEAYDPVVNSGRHCRRRRCGQRIEAAAVWSGSAVLIVGGADARTADTPRMDTLADGAALTPGSVPDAG